MKRPLIAGALLYLATLSPALGTEPRTFGDLGLVPTNGEALAICRNDTLVIAIDVQRDASRFSAMVDLDSLCRSSRVNARPEPQPQVPVDAPLSMDEARVVCDGRRLSWFGMVSKAGVYATEIDLTKACSRRYSTST